MTVLCAIVGPKKARRQRPNWSLTLLTRPAEVAAGDLFVCLPLCCDPNATQQSSRPFDPVEASHLHVSKVEYVPSTPSSYPHHGTIKSYRDCAIRETQNGCHTIELFGLLQAGHYSPGCAKALTQVSPKRISGERSAFPATVGRASASLPLPLCLHVGKRGVSAL